MGDAPSAVALALSPFDRHCGVELTHCDDRLVRAYVPVRPHLTQPLGMVHGGVYAAIAEGLASLGTNHGVARDGCVGLGQSNACSFLRPVRDGRIHAEARVRHRGRSTWVWDVQLEDDRQRLCAIGRVTVAVRPWPPAA